MKKMNLRKLVLLAIASFIVSFAQAQSSKGFNYQAIVKDAQGNKIAEKKVGVKISLQNASDVVYYTETHSTKTDKNGVIALVIGKGTSVDNKKITDVKWHEGEVYIQLAIDTKGGKDYKKVGNPTMLQSVPYALYAEQSGRLIQSKSNASDEEPIFEVKNKKGQTVFAVYQNGATVYVNEETGKGARGGFAVATRGPIKGQEGEADILNVNNDNIRFYVKETKENGKGARGGFAVATRGPIKGQSKEMFAITGDNQVKVIVNETNGKGARGGFAVATRGPIKGQEGEADILNINNDSIRFYLKETKENGKGARGGFAVATRGPIKGQSKEMFAITGDNQVKVIVNETNGKGARGGFAVATRGPIKGQEGEADILNINNDSVRFYIDKPKEGTKGARGGFAVATRNFERKGGSDDLFYMNECQTVFNICETSEEGFKVQKTTKGNETPTNLLTVKPSGDLDAKGAIASQTSTQVEKIYTGAQGAFKLISMGTSYDWMDQNLAKFTDSVPVDPHNPVLGYIPFSNKVGKNAYYDIKNLPRICSGALPISSPTILDIADSVAFIQMFQKVNPDFSVGSTTDNKLTATDFAKLITLSDNTWENDFRDMPENPKPEFNKTKMNVKKYPHKKIKIQKDSNIIKSITWDEDYVSAFVNSDEEEVASWWYGDSATPGIVSIVRKKDNPTGNYHVVFTPHKTLTQDQKETLLNSVRCVKKN